MDTHPRQAQAKDAAPLGIRRYIALICVLLLTIVPLAGCSKAPFVSSEVPTPTPTVATTMLADASPTDTLAQSTVDAQQPTNTTVVQPTSTSKPTDTPQPPPDTVPPADSATPAPTLTATVTVTPTATATLTITAPIRLANEPACDNELVRIMGISVEDRTVEFTGTAAIGEFWYYKFEYQGLDEADWHYIDKSETPVENGSLYTWDTAMLAPGNYRVNLVVVDKTGNYPSPCGVEIEIME